MMSEKTIKRNRKFVRYMKETYVNKLVALLLLVITYIPIVLDHDATVFVFTLMIAVPLFLSKRNWFYKD